jgi:pSer/pThr/pTyr-binding forkhead associated (FHA) protein
VRQQKTRPLGRAGRAGGIAKFLERQRATLIVLEGEAQGAEFPLDRERVVLGRGPGVDLAFEDDAMSRLHAAIEWAEGGFSVVDLGSTNGTKHNGAAVERGELKHGDRIELGEHEFQFLLEARERKPRTHVLPGAD